MMRPLGTFGRAPIPNLRCGLVALAAALVALFGRAPDVAHGGFLSGEASNNPSQKLKSLFKEYWDDELRTDPLGATFNGDHRFDDRLPDFSEAAHAQRVERDRARRTALEQIKPESLAEAEQIDREVLLTTLNDRLDGEPFRGWLIPITQQEGIHLNFAQSVNFHPKATVGDLENYVRRLRAFPQAIDQTIVLMRKGMAEKRVPPRITMAQVVPQLRELTGDNPEKSPLWGIVTQLEGWSEADRKQAQDQVRSEITNSVFPAYAKLLHFVEAEYLPACRDSVGLWDSPDGTAHYAFRARSFTTTALSPDQIHEIGLDEMARIQREMEAIRKRVKFDGDLKAFFQHLKTEPRFKNQSEEDLLARYRKIFEAIDAKLPELFAHLPRTDYGIRPIEAYRAKAAAAGYYYPAPDDGSRPGYFYVNTSDPTSRTTYSMQALAYHEGVPGHHLQFSLAMEAPGRPAFRRFGYVPAFSEGWGLYSEGLPREVGLYTDPYAEFGQLEYSAWRAGRLVVDTGIHHKKWTRDQAIQYLEENTAVPRNEIESEIDRYIAWPGQALAYKIGELKIKELRARAEHHLASKFDLRAFHDKLLSFGSVPLSVLEKYLAPESLRTQSQPRENE